MKRKKWVQLAILTAILMIAVFTLANDLFDKSDEAPAVGSAAPNFKLVDLNGKVHELSDYRGQNVVINFWGTWCPPCRLEMPDLENQYQEWKDKGFEILGVNLKGDSKLSTSNFVSKYGLNFPILPDTEDEVRKKYWVTQYPTTFFINKQGIIEKIKIGQMDEAFIHSTLAGMDKQSGG